MMKFAAVAALAVTASAVNKGTLEMQIDNFEYDVQSIPQGKGKIIPLIYSNAFLIIGQDHTLWSWGELMHTGEDEIYILNVSVEETQRTIERTQIVIDEFWNGITSTEVSHQL